MVLWTYQQRDHELLPQADRHGRGFMGRTYTPEEMYETAINVSVALEIGTSLPGYGKRFFSGGPFPVKEKRRLLLPDGFDATNHPNRAKLAPALLELVDIDRLTAPPDALMPWQMPDALQHYYGTMRWELDQHGRACNPHLQQLIEDKRIGLNTGLGASYTCGESIAVDVIVDDGAHVLLAQGVDLRGDALPSLAGGYTRPKDYGVTNAEWCRGIRPITREGIFWAAQRIILTDTGIQLPTPHEAEYDIVWGFYPALPDHTANAWTVDFTVRVRVEDGLSRQLTPRTDNILWITRSRAFAALPMMLPDQRRSLRASLTIG